MPTLLVRAIRRVAVPVAILALAFAHPASAGRLGPLPASYSGQLPCADCAGIRYQLNLYPGGGYILALTYLKSPKDETFHVMGSFTMNKDSTRLVLDFREPKAMQFALPSAGTLRKLDSDGRAIKSKANHDLLREPALLQLEPRLRFIGAYFYMADVGVLTDCRSGLQFPVAPGEVAHELEKAFLATAAMRDSVATLHEKASQQGQTTGAHDSSLIRTPVLVSVQARVLSRPPEGIEGDKPMFLVERLLDTYPNESCEARGVRYELEGTRWVLTRLGAESVWLAPGQREQMIAFDNMADRVSGYSGCNRFSSLYTIRPGGGLALALLAGTRMACVGPDLETPFLRALSRVQGYRITGSHLELLDAAGVTLMRLEARNL